MNAQERQERARLGAGTRWSKPGARERQADAARAAMYRRLRDQVDPDGVMSPDELADAIRAATAATPRVSVSPNYGRTKTMSRREYVRRILARCYVAMAEVDYDLRRWRESVHPR